MPGFGKKNKKSKQNKKYKKSKKNKKYKKKSIPKAVREQCWMRYNGDNFKARCHVLLVWIFFLMFSISMLDMINRNLKVGH